VETWYEIREEAIDNILDATIMWLALREYGSLTPQAGGEIITRTIKYGTKNKQNISKGKTLQRSVAKRETMAWHDWKYIAIDVNRTLLDDQKNHGPSKIKDYVTKRIMGAHEDIIQDCESDLFSWQASDADGDQINGIWDLIPIDVDTVTGLPAGNGTSTIGQTRTTGSFGNQSRTNTWWQSKQLAGSNPELNLRNNMTTLYNDISDNVKAPNFIICDQDLYEYYEDEVMDRQQVVRTGFTTLAADLGFEAITFKGKPMSWTSQLDATDKLLMLDMDDIELVYDPDYFFDMTEWFTTPDQLERVAYIISAMQLILSQPRRHGMLDYNATSQ
jgi:hypothetical protein